MQKPLPIFFIGVGKFGSMMKFLLETQRSDEIIIKDIHKKTGDPNILTKMLNDKDIAAAYICSPDDTHHTLMLQCLEHGKHVFSEKPVYDYEKVMKKAKECDKIIQVGFQRRFHKDFIEMKSQFSTNCPEKITFEAYDPTDANLDAINNPDDLKTVICNSLCHDMDLLLHTFTKINKITWIKVIPKEFSGCEIKAKIIYDNDKEAELSFAYRKGYSTYVNRVTVEKSNVKSVFGFEYDARISDYEFKHECGCEIYSDAYMSQFDRFKDRIQGTVVDKDLPSTFLKTFSVMSDCCEFAEKSLKDHYGEPIYI